MDFKKLQYFLTVAEEGHITKAAKRLHMAQPPLSHQIKVFERELGVQLIEKVGRQIRITKVGLALRDRGEQIMELVNKTATELKDLNDGLQGTLSIGSVATWGATLLPDRILNFNKHYPAIRFHLWEDTPQRITELLNNGIIEIAIIPLPFDSAIYESIALPSEPVVAAMNVKWNDTPSTDHISLLELADKPLLLPRRNKSIMEKYYRRNNLEPNILCLHDDVRSLLDLANAGLGVALVPQIATQLMQNTNIVYKEITTPSLTIDTSVVWMKDRYISTATKRFLATFSKDNV